MKVIFHSLVSIVLSLFCLGDKRKDFSVFEYSFQKTCYQNCDTFYLDTLIIDNKWGNEYKGWSVKEGTPALFAYVIKNQTDNKIEIDLSSNCGCLFAYNSQRNLLPGESDRVIYKLATEQRKGKCAKMMYVNYRNFGTNEEYERIIIWVIGTIE